MKGKARRLSVRMGVFKHEGTTEADLWLMAGTNGSSLQERGMKYQ